MTIAGIVVSLLAASPVLAQELEGGMDTAETAASGSVLSRKSFRDRPSHIYIRSGASTYYSPAQGLTEKAPNARMFNNAFGGNSSYYMYGASEYQHPLSLEIGVRSINKSQTRAWELFVSHKKANPGLTQAYRPYSMNYATSIGSAGNSLLLDGIEKDLYVSNKIRTAQIGFNNDFFILRGNPNKFIQPLGFRLGILFEGDRAEYEGMTEHAVSRMEYTDGSDPSALTNLIPLLSRGGVRTRNWYGTGQLVMGVNYAIGFFNRSTLDFGVDFLYGTGMGEYSKRKYLIPIASGIVLPREIVTKYKYRNTVIGQKWEMGYSFDLDGFSIRVFGEYEDKEYRIHSVQSTTTTGYTALTLATANVLAIIGESQDPMGPHPEPHFRNEEIGIEFQLHM